jgi:Ca2+-binding RTX toxin-like protein
LEITSDVFGTDAAGNVVPFGAPALIALGTQASLAWEQGVLASFVLNDDANYVHPGFFGRPIGTVGDLPFALTPPTVLIGSTGGLTNQPSQSISGTVQETDVAIGTTVSLYDNNVLLGTASVQSDGTWKTTVTLSGDGTHTIVAQDTDVAGDIGSSNSVVFTLDTTPPVNTILGEALINGKLVLIGTTGEANDTIAVYDGKTLLGSTTTASDGSWSFGAGTPSNVVHTYTTTAADVLGNIGPGSNEAIYGTAKADTLVGGSGNDVILGNGGNDKITGGLGADLLTGGSGNVTFIDNAAADSTPASHDTITDFRHNHDTIDLTNIPGINASHGIPTFEGKLIGSGNLTLNAHSVAYLELGGNTEVLVNTTSTPEIVHSADVSAANMEIVLVGIHLGLTATDFHHI